MLRLCGEESMSWGDLLKREWPQPEDMPTPKRKTTSLVERGRDKPQQAGSIAQQEKRLGEDYRKDSDNFASFTSSNLNQIVNQVKVVKSDAEVIQILKTLQDDIAEWISTAEENN